MEKVTVARRLRAMSRDRGKTSPSAGLELGRLAEDVAALEELAEATEGWVRGRFGYSRDQVLVVLEELEARGGPAVTAQEKSPADLILAALEAALEELADQDSVESTVYAAGFIRRRVLVVLEELKAREERR